MGVLGSNTSREPKDGLPSPFCGLQCGTTRTEIRAEWLSPLQPLTGDQVPGQGPRPGSSKLWSLVATPPPAVFSLPHTQALSSTLAHRCCWRAGPVHPLC